MSGGVRLETAEPVSWVTFEHPGRRNALTGWPSPSRLAITDQVAAGFASDDLQESRRTSADKRPPALEGS